MTIVEQICADYEKATGTLLEAAVATSRLDIHTQSE
jgi:hypothetical protein